MNFLGLGLFVEVFIVGNLIILAVVEAIGALRAPTAITKR
jgi:hypothetical protein